MRNIIETQRLMLRPWEATDIQAVYEGLGDYDIAKFLTVPFPYTLETAKAFISNRIQNQNTRTKSYFAIVEKASGKVIGGTNIEVGEDNSATGGIWFNKNYHGKGYGTEAMRARAEFCFDDLEVECLNNGFLEGNEISCRMQQKIGYKLTGEVAERNCPARGGLVKDIKTKLTKEDFFKNNKGC